ncbi:MAG: hypothetical protein IPP77_02650 [Bacteroidetes bacterium]|nr:hypothetical protein [Bacteroidota bacterium]
MKNKLSILATLIISLLIFNSCSKITNDPTDPNTKQHNEDINNQKGESDNVNSDVNNAMFNIGGFVGKKEGIQGYSICGATIDSSHQNDPQPYILINFDGTTVCPNPNRIRSGQIKVQLIVGNSWADVGATAEITHTDYKVVYTGLNNHYLTFNGIKYLTNVSGMDILSYVFTGAATVILKERSSNMTATFENGQTSSWNMARRSTWAITGYSNIAATVNGDTTVNGKILDSWGKTRFNTDFQTEMIQPWKSGTACGWWRPIAGKYTSTTTNFSVTATFGVNSNGSPVSTGCPSYLKLEWILGNNAGSGQAVLGYW